MAAQSSGGVTPSAAGGGDDKAPLQILWSWVKTPNPLIWVFAGLSWWTTSQGIIGLVSDRSNADIPEFVVLSIVVAAFTLAMVFFVRGMFQPGVGWGLRAAFIAGYVAAMVLSVTFGFGYYWRMLNANSETRDDVQTRVEEIGRKLNTTVSQLENVQRALDNLRVRSETQAAVERAGNDSCNIGTPAGPGPVYQMRTEQKERYTIDSQQAGALHAALVASRTSINTEAAAFENGSISRGQLGPRLAAFNALVSTAVADYNTGLAPVRSRATAAEPIADPAYQQWRGYREQAGRYQSGRSNAFHWANYDFHCIDSNMSAALLGAANAVDAIQPLTFEPIQNRDTAARAISTAFARLSASIADALHVPIAQNAERLRQQDWVPLAIAGIVDFMLFMVSMVEAALRRDTGKKGPEEIDTSGTTWDPTSSYPNALSGAGALVPERLFEDAEIMLADSRWQMLQDYSFIVDGREYVAVPRKAESVEDRIMNNAMILLSATDVAKPVRFDRGSLAQTMRAKGRRVSSAGFDAWLLRPGARADLLFSVLNGIGDRVIDL